MENFVEYGKGLRMPSVGFGTWQLSDGEEVYKSVKAALETGYRHIDTATSYQNENGVGLAIKDSNLAREDIFVTTKLPNNVGTYNEALEAIEESLQKLQLEYIDLYLIHWPNPLPHRTRWQDRNKEVWRAMEEYYRKGKIKSIGVSNFLVKHLESLTQEAVVYPQVNQLFITPGMVNNEIIDYCKKNNILIQAYSPLGRGHVVNSDEMNGLAKKYHKTPAQLTLAWCLQKGFIPLTRTTKYSRLKENLDIFDISISTEDLDKISNLPTDLEYSNPDTKEY